MYYICKGDVKRVEDYIEERVLNAANIIIKKDKTVREIAKDLYVDKTTIHNDLVKRLPKINYEKFLLVRKILDTHTKERSIKGGMATKEKYLKEKNKTNGME